MDITNDKGNLPPPEVRELRKLSLKLAKQIKNLLGLDSDDAINRDLLAAQLATTLGKILVRLNLEGDEVEYIKGLMQEIDSDQKREVEEGDKDDEADMEQTLTEEEEDDE